MSDAHDHGERDLERGSSHDDMPHDEKLRNMLTNTMTLSPDMFERMYLSPKGQVNGELRKTLANPTPIALLGFSVGLFPLSIAFMGWRGAGGFAIATTTTSLWFGGLLLIIAGLGEFIVGNTFPMVVFMGYGAHFLTFATTFIPWFNAVGFFAPSTSGTPGQAMPSDAALVAEGVTTPMFLASYAYYPLALGMLSFVFLIGSLRTNLAFVMIFVFATLGFLFGAGGFFQLAQGNMLVGNRLVVGLGGAFFGADMCGWYLLLAIMIQTMELPIPDLPVFDLSQVIKARPRGVPKEQKKE